MLYKGCSRLILLLMLGGILLGVRTAWPVVKDFAGSLLGEERERAERTAGDVRDHVSGRATRIARERSLDSFQGPTYPVTRVVDGDTVEIRQEGEEVKLRLIGINTPEVHGPEAVQCFGPEASARAKRLLVGKLVRIQGDPTQDAEDRYGRRLVYLYLANGKLFQESMLREGYAKEYTYDEPYKFQKRFRDAERQARRAKRGLWSPDTCWGDTEKQVDANGR